MQNFLLGHCLKVLHQWSPRQAPLTNMAALTSKSVIAGLCRRAWASPHLGFHLFVEALRIFADRLLRALLTEEELSEIPGDAWHMLAPKPSQRVSTRWMSLTYISRFGRKVEFFDSCKDHPT